jgi:HlyD family secretion protein
MDKARDPAYKRNRKIRRVIYSVLGLAAVAGISIGLSKMRPAPPSIDAGTVWPDTVKQGEMVVNVRGMGTLVPERLEWIAATTSGRVDNRLVERGQRVTPDTVLFEMSNPELEQQFMDAEAQMKSAEAAYSNRKTELESQLLTQIASAAQIEASYQQARLEAEARTALFKERLSPEIEMKKAQSSAAELATRLDIERKRIEMTKEAMKTQMAVSQASLDQTKVMLDLRKRQVADLKVRAKMHGILQELPVQIGQQVTPGTNLARVSDPTRLKAEVRIAETQAKDMVEGLPAEIDTRNGFIKGRVKRVDPSVVNGTRMVEVELLGELPKGAVPDLNVDGTIELNRLTNVLKIQRPAFGQEGSTIKLFKYEPDGKYAEAVTVSLGKTSVTEVEIKSGLKVGDKVIVSDTSQIGDNVNRIRLN